jgi:hypothetical protein
VAQFQALGGIVSRAGGEHLKEEEPGDTIAVDALDPSVDVLKFGRGRQSPGYVPTRHRKAPALPTRPLPGCA